MEEITIDKGCGLDVHKETVCRLCYGQRDQERDTHFQHEDE